MDSTTLSSNSISKRTARRYVLGRQGLWPGHRWAGQAGVADAIAQSEAIQVDTINIVARSHDLALWSRVHDYKPADLNHLVYNERQFFDYGSILMLYPALEFPHWQAIMAGWQVRLADYAEANQPLFEHVRQELTTRGPLGSRDFANRERIPGGFRTVKDTGKALYYMWLSGEIMTHSRRGFERIYDFQHRVLPTGAASDMPTAEHFLYLKALRDCGLATSTAWDKRAAIMRHRSTNTKAAVQILEQLVAQGEVAKVSVVGHTQAYYLPQADLALLNLLESGQVPPQWQPVDGLTTLEQVNILAPLDNVIWDRGRVKSLFDFDYVWEVYKPVHLRRWGYYTMPILYGDELVGRLSPKLERKTSKLIIEGLWLEQPTLASDPAFQAAFKAGLQAFAAFHAATEIVAPADTSFPELFE